MVSRECIGCWGLPGLAFPKIPHLWLAPVLVGGLGHPSEKNEFINWDDDIPNINGNIQKMATSPHQPE